MGTKPFLKRAVMLSAIVLVWAFPNPSRAADQLKNAAVVGAPVAEGKIVPAGGIVAAGAVEDTLKACLARIPQDASAGQRMVAEQSCQRDEGSRAPFQMGSGR